MLDRTDEFQLVTDTLIHFYTFEKQDDKFIPVLTNSMFNFAKCNQMIIDRDSTLCITYKVGEPSLNVFKRKFNHGFSEIIDKTSRENCSAALLEKSR